MGKLEEREARRKSAVAGMVAEGPQIRKRVCITIRPELHEEVRRLTYMERKTVSGIIEELLEGYVAANPNHPKEG